MQVPPQVSSQLNLAGGQVLLQQQEAVADTPLNNQVSVAFADEETPKDDLVVEKTLSAFPTEVSII